MSAYSNRPFKGIPVHDDDVRVVAYRSPFEQEKAETFFGPGLTIREIVDRVGCGARHPFKVTIYGVEVPAEYWHIVKPKPGTVVVMIALAKAPIGAIFAAIGAAVTSFQAFVSGLGFLGKILMAGLSIGFNLLINSLFAPPKPEQPKQPKEGYNFAGSRNQATPFDPIPVNLGYNRVTPVLLAQTYTEDVGDDQYINLKMTGGYGPCQWSDIRIGDTPIGEFDDCDYETREGWSSDTETTIYNRYVTEETLGITLEGPDDATPTTYKPQTRYTQSNVNKIGVNFYYPSGLIRYDSEGKKRSITSTLKIRYRPYPGGGAWTNRPDLVTTRKTQDPIRVGDVWTVTAGPQYEVEIYRENPEPPANATAQRYQTVIWGSLKGFRRGQPVTCPIPLTEIAVRIRATGQLSGTVDTLNAVLKSYVAKKWYSGSWHNDELSNRPHDLFRHVLQGAANARPRTDSQINLTAIQNWGNYCNTQGFTYNRPIQDQSSVFDTCQRIAAAGRATMIFTDNKWSVVYDDANPAPVAMFTPRNSWGFEGKHSYIDMPHGFRVQFPNELKRYVQDERVVYDDGYSAANATKIEGLDLPGITHPDLIYRHARFHLAQLRLRPATYQFYTDFEALRLTRGDRIYVQQDIMLVGAGSGRVTGVSGQYVTFDEEQILGGSPYIMRFRKTSDGTFFTRQVVDGQTGRRTMLLLNDIGGTVTTMPSIGDIWTIGPSGSDSGVYRVSGIEPQDDLSFLVTCVDDAPEIDNADTGTIPPFDSNVVEPVDIYTLAPTGLSTQTTPYQQGNVWLGEVVFAWVAPAYGNVVRYNTQYYDDGKWYNGPSVAAPTAQVTFRNLAGDTYRFRVRAVFDTGDISGWAATSDTNLNYLSTPPITVPNFQVNTVGTNNILSWNSVPGCTYEVRYISSGTVDWNNGIVLATGITATNYTTAGVVGTYLIKAVNQFGVKSNTAAQVFTNISQIMGMNAVTTTSQHPTFSGTKTNTTVVSNVLKLSAITGGVQPEGYYEFAAAVDLSAIYTSRLTFDIAAVGEDVANVMSTWTTLAGVPALDQSAQSDWGVELQMKTSTDGTNYTADWVVVQPGDVTARAFKFRLRLWGYQADPDIALATVTPAVSTLTVKIDMPDRVFGESNLSSTTSGLVVTFANPFKGLAGVGIAIQNQAQGDYYVLSNKAGGANTEPEVDGFKVVIRNSGGTAIDKKFNYVARGWGQKV